MKKNQPAIGSSAVRFALTEPLTAGDVYEAKTNSVDCWAWKGSKQMGNIAFLGVPSLVRRFTRNKNAHECVRAFLIALPTVPLAAIMAVGGWGSMLVVTLAPKRPEDVDRRSDAGVWEERLARAMDLDTRTLTGLAKRLSGTELQKQLDLERTLLAEVSKRLAGQGKRTRCSEMLKSRLRAWNTQIEQLGYVGKQIQGRPPVSLDTSQNLNER